MFEELVIVSEAPTPHNNLLFETISMGGEVKVSLFYVYKSTSVPGRPWKGLPEAVGKSTARSGVSSFFDFQLIKLALTASRNTLFLVIGWNHPIFVMLILILGLRRHPFGMWFDTPKMSSDIPDSRFKLFMKSMLVKLINRSPGPFFVTGKRAKDRYGELGIVLDKLKNMPFFVPHPNIDEHYKRSYFELRSNFGIPKNSVLFLAAGRLIRSKGFDLLIDAVTVLKKRNVLSFHVLLIGSGEEASALRRCVGERLLQDTVTMMDWCEPDRYQEYLKMADVFVAPARFDPFPTTVLSAMAHAKTVIASNQTFSAVEFIKHGVNGYIFESGDISSLALTMEQLILDRARLEAMGRQARFTMNEWNVQRGCKIVLDAFKSVSS